MAKDYGSKPRSGGPPSTASEARDCQDRLRGLILKPDLTKDPYIMRNHLGIYECKLCLTSHKHEYDYLSHTQCKRHQLNLANRATYDTKYDSDTQNHPKTRSIIVPRKTGKSEPMLNDIRKQYDPVTKQRSILIQIKFPEIEKDKRPKYRIMSCFEQKIEGIDNRFQYLVFAAEPYKSVAYKIPNVSIDKVETLWDLSSKLFALQLFFKV